MSPLQMPDGPRSSEDRDYIRSQNGAGSFRSASLSLSLSLSIQGETTKHRPLPPVPLQTVLETAVSRPLQFLCLTNVSLSPLLVC